METADSARRPARHPGARDDRRSAPSERPRPAAEALRDAVLRLPQHEAGDRAHRRIAASWCWRSSARGSPTPIRSSSGIPLGEPPSSRVLARHHLRRARTSTRSSSTGCARASSSARSRRCVAGVLGMAIGFVGGYLGGDHRRHPQHAHEHRPRDPDARRPDHRRRLPQRRQPDVGGGPDRAHLLALGRARDPGADVLARRRATSSTSRACRAAARSA